jgi:quercetin dioxygenase-like cupin family protein
MSCDDELDPDALAQSSLFFRRRVVELEPGRALPVEPAAWTDAIVFVTAGEIEVECDRGGRRRFSSGAILCFTPPVREIRNCGDDHAQLVAVSRRTRHTG